MATTYASSEPDRGTVRSRASKVFCEHCRKLVGRSTYYRHRSRFYDTRKRRWILESTSDIDVPHQNSSSEAPSEPEHNDPTADVPAAANNFSMNNFSPDEQGKLYKNWFYKLSIISVRFVACF